YAKNYSDIYYKASDMDTIAFDGASLGTPFMVSGTSPVTPDLGGPGGINNPSGMKDNNDPSTGILLIAATTETNRYWHNWIYLPTPKPVVSISTPSDGIKLRSGASLTFTATATSPTDGVITPAIK